MSQPLTTDREPSGFATGVAYFAGTVLVVNGLLQLLNGISALSRGDFYVSTQNYIYNINLSGWGWIHLIIGVLAIIIGVGVFMGQTWANATALVLAVLSLIANFMFIPYYPLWALLIIALDVLVIWALSRVLATVD